ncbi:hypothetical protein RHGRI_005231 [Rhododendron griersonianum]|uniref:TOD1/MUCI70 glycosyltransferase-like domain-containing protein n=1 Tax=Rhododendron griersonianum TaxID=479676 RepID=A0AAV6LEN6_9ERIC|nr:hypothetical protein RHGRI_005231 [Rhododendron griersonianum]
MMWFIEDLTRDFSLLIQIRWSRERLGSSSLVFRHHDVLAAAHSLSDADLSTTVAYLFLEVLFLLMDNITIFDQVDNDLRATVQLLQKRNVVVAIHVERELNVMSLRHGWVKELCSEGLPTGKLWDIVIVIDYVAIDALSRFNDANSEVLALESQPVSSPVSSPDPSKSKPSKKELSLLSLNLDLTLGAYESDTLFGLHDSIHEGDRNAMEKCNGVVVVSAIFCDHDKIRQPKGLGSKTLDHVCFFMFVDNSTLTGLRSHNLIPEKTREEKKIGVWRIISVSTEHLYANAAMNGVIPKHLVHRLFPNAIFSMWIDAKLQLVVDPLLLIHALVITENVDMAISRHPYYMHTMEEAMATARWKKWWDVDSLKRQMETYYVPDSALIVRKHSIASSYFSCLLFNELEAFNPRDQLAFAYVRDKMKPTKQLRVNMFDVQVFEQVAVEYRHNLKQGGPSSSSAAQVPKTKRATSDLFVNGSCSRCDGYLLTMWGESHD